MMIVLHSGKDGEELSFHAEQITGARQCASQKYPETQSCVDVPSHRWGFVFVRESVSQVRRKVNSALREKYRLQAGTATDGGQE